MPRYRQMSLIAKSKRRQDILRSKQDFTKSPRSNDMTARNALAMALCANTYLPFSPEIPN